ncbi:ABCB1 [Symbiodinium natans]|uniref:ABCB1 protein n=1 Tax=Symbiodinium natans TaxID=878477 RepID=A0A812RS55_9DINO|nr:ABCB1 [Symbiodinium natans]
MSEGVPIERSEAVRLEIRQQRSRCYATCMCLCRQYSNVHSVQQPVIAEAAFTPIHGSPKSPFVDIDALADLEVAPQAEQWQESDKDKRKREAQEKCEELKEWGGKASLAALLSLTTCKEKLVLALGFLGAFAHGAGQPVMILMWGDLIDGLGTSVSADFDMQSLANMTTEQLQAVQEAANDQMMESVGAIALKFVVIGCCVCGAAALQGFAFPWFVDSQLAKMRPLYFDAMLHRDVGWFDTHSPGALPGEMTADLETFAEGFGSKLGVSAMAFAGLCVGLTVGFVLSWEIALLMLVTLPLMAIGAMVMSSAVLDARREVQGPYEKAAELADEVLYAIRTVVAFGGEAHELKRYSSAADLAKRGGLKNRVKTGIGMGYIWLIYFCSMALAFWGAMTLMYNGKEDLSAGKVLSAFMCILTVGFMIGKIGPGFAGVAAAQASMARFFYVVKNESVIQKRLRDDRKTVGPIETLELDEVHFAYPARPEMKILHGLSLTIKKGQKVAVVGESGSGKSTIMALLERFYDPQLGAVRINGEDLRELNIESYRKQIGYVGQEPVLFATSVRANILQGCRDATEEDFEAAAHNAQLDFVKALPEQFDTYVGSGGSQFSGGQKQRIAIARALLKKPSIMFLDEATSALDSSCEKLIQQTIDNLGKSTWLGRMTIVSIAHRLSTVQNSDVIYVLENGVVAESGTHKELTSQEGGIYQALAAAQGAVLARKGHGLEDR